MDVNDLSNTAAIYLKCRQQILEGGFFFSHLRSVSTDLPALAVENIVFSFVLFSEFFPLRDLSGDLN